jgi:hypothetical protein
VENILIYATLSAIKESKGNISSILEIFQDLVETAIKQHFDSTGKRGYINELQSTIKNVYHLNMPLPTLELILKNINKEYSGLFHVYADHSFDFSDVVFIDVTQLIEQQKTKLDILNRLFIDTKEKMGIKNTSSLNEIVEKNKNNLLAYFNNRPIDTIIENDDFDILLSFLRIPEHKDLIENLFLGALISCFTLLDPERTDDKKTMLLDTNFIISLMDLHSTESFETCKQILQIGKKIGYDFCILPETITEIKNLLHRKSNEIKEIPLFAAQDRNSIEFGCYRKDLTGYDLLEFEKLVESFLYDKKIRVLDTTINERLKRNAVNSDIYRMIGNRQRNKIGALHDTMAMNFVKEYRTGEESSFSDTVSFFVTDSHGYVEKKISLSTKLPLVIRAEELITLLWLVYPYHDTGVIKTEISKIFSMHLNKKLPNKDMLSSIDNKNRSYKALGIRAKDCVKLAFDINELESHEIEKLLSITEEDEYLKEIGRLANLASERREEHEEKISYYVESVIDSTWEENNKTMLNENNSLKQIAAATTKENEKLRILKNKNELDITIEAQKEIIDQMNERISELNNPIRFIAKVSAILLIFASIIGIILFGKLYIIPEWNNIQPHILITEMLLPLLVALTEIMGFFRKTSYIRLSKLLIRLIFKKQINKIMKLRRDLNEKKSYLSSLEDRRKDIIY